MASNPGASGYNDSNRAFLQAFMARSFMTLEEARPVLAAILSAHGLFLSSILRLWDQWTWSADWAT